MKRSSLVCILLMLAPLLHAADWVQPTTQKSSPLWGHVDGIRVGLAPLPGPRGLLRIYTPYLGQADDHVINFIAVEPIVAGETRRGLSELEHSKLDDTAGKRLWCEEAPEAQKLDGVDTLRVKIEVERFDNGAHVYLRLTFRTDRPHEVAIGTFAHDDSKPLANCIVTATMGNYARLRKLELADRIVTSHELWPKYSDDGFSPPVTFPLSKLKRNDRGDAIASATPDELRPDAASYPPMTRKHWRYTGKTATQFWRCELPDPALKAAVNGRCMYWRSQTAIPNGIAFENFELIASFKQGGEFVFAVEPR
jgi:hypothetical protein